MTKNLSMERKDLFNFFPVDSSYYTSLMERLQVEKIKKMKK